MLARIHRLTRPIAIGILVLAVPPTVFLASRRDAAVVDVHNESMKSVGTPEAAAMNARVQDFGTDRSIVIGLQWNSEQRRLEDARETGDLIASLRGNSSVERVERLGFASKTLLAIEVGLTRDSASDCERSLEAILKVVHDGRPTAARILTSGQIAGEVAIARAVATEQRTVFPFVAAVLALVLFAIYRNLAIVLAALLPAGAAVLWTGGLHALAGNSVNPLSTLLEPVLLTVSVATSVHIIEGYLAQRSRGLTPEVAAIASLRDLLRPTFLTVGTTALGFATLLASEIPAVTGFAGFAAMGVVLAGIASFTIGSSVLVCLLRGQKLHRLVTRQSGLASFFRRCAARLYRRRGAIAALTVAVFVGALSRLPQLHADTDPIRILSEDDPFRHDLAAFEAESGSTSRFDLVLPNAEHGTRIAGAILELPGIVQIASRPRKAENGRMLLSFLTDVRGSAKQTALFDRVEDCAERIAGPDVVVTGTLVQVARDSERLVRRRMYGMGTMLGALFIVFAVAFRSIGLALASLVPNLLPAALVYASLTVSGQALNVATAMIGSVMLGLVVDDTIHFVYRFREAKTRGATARVAVAESLRTAGIAIGITSIALTAGFVASLAGSLTTTREFGTVAAGTIVLALVADLVLLPALLMLGRKRSTNSSRTPELGVAA